MEEQADAACSSSNAARIRSRKEISDESRGGLLEVYDAIGRVVHTETLTQLQTQIDSDQWAAGVYTLRIVKDNRGASLRVIKE